MRWEIFYVQRCSYRSERFLWNVYVNPQDSHVPLTVLYDSYIAPDGVHAYTLLQEIRRIPHVSYMYQCT